MKKKKYTIIKHDEYTNITFLNIKKLKGFKFKPMNKVSYDGITVNKMTIINNTFVEKVLKRKIKKRLEVYLRFIISLVDSDEDCDPTDLRSALNDLSRYKESIKNKYQFYLEQKYITLLLKKIDLLEKELKNKLLENNLIIEEHKRSR